MIKSHFLVRYRMAFIIWCIVASFGVYFCMYAFRKPFNTGLYPEAGFWGIGYKTVLIISQVLGYMLSKFAGIKVISELKVSARVTLIIALILIAEVALLLFGIVPYPYNFICLFINGLPLGMVYGVVFSFLEGRRFTEMIAMGLNISVIVASGILKTIYIDVHAAFPFISEFWMPCVMGLIFLPAFFFFVWMLTQIPAPTEEDIRLRTERIPMTRADKIHCLKKFGLPIACFIVCYSMLTMVRDYRDNFTIEIWNEIDAGWDSSVLSATEMIAGFTVLVVLGSLSFIRSNVIAFRWTNIIVFAGIALTGFATWLFSTGAIDGFYWMLFVGIGVFLAYTAILTVVFERMIALFRLKANAGFFVYLCDSIGYLGSVGLLLYKEFFMHEVRWSQVLMRFILLQCVIGLALTLLANFFFARRGRILRQEGTLSSDISPLGEELRVGR